MVMTQVKMDKGGRLLIPIKERNRLGIKAGTEFQVSADNGVLILKPALHAQLYVDAGHRNWGKEAFLDAGDSTFGEQ